MEQLLRKDVPVESTWNREAVYATWEDWQADLAQAGVELAELSAFTGTLSQSPEQLLKWFNTVERHARRLYKLTTFARLARVVDTTDEEAGGYFGQVMGFVAQFGAATAFAEPEMMARGETIAQWIDDHPDLALYKQYFANLIRQKPHRRSAEVEALLSQLADPFGGAATTASTLANTDLKFTPAVDSKGKEHAVGQATVAPVGIQSSDREQRRTAWESFCDGYLGMQNTLASAYTTSVKQQTFLARARGYDSVLEMILAPTNLPVAVFHNVINTFKANLPVWHRYWTAKRKILGVAELHPYDIWAPIVSDPPHIPYKEGVGIISEAMAPLGAEYVSVMSKGCLEERWVDYAPNVGKMQGAAASARIDTPPFIFMSYDDTMMGVSVLAHELGHSMHSYYADVHQPIVYQGYDAINMAVAETASNFNQALLAAHVQKSQPDDRKMQLALLDAMFFNFHRYFFIMPTLARFEFEVYERAQKGQPLTAPILNEIMSRMYAEGYGTTMTDDPGRTAITWAQFGHLYAPFYTFQYSVGISAATALADRVLTHGPSAAESYLGLLKAGGSLYPMALFTNAGVDMSTPEPVEKAFAFLNGLVDQLEQLADA